MKIKVYIQYFSTFDICCIKPIVVSMTLIDSKGNCGKGQTRHTRHLQITSSTPASDYSTGIHDHRIDQLRNIKIQGISYQATYIDKRTTYKTDIVNILIHSCNGCPRSATKSTIKSGELGLPRGWSRVPRSTKQSDTLQCSFRWAFGSCFSFF